MPSVSSFSENSLAYDGIATRKTSLPLPMTSLNIVSSPLVPEPRVPRKQQGQRVQQQQSQIIGPLEPTFSPPPQGSPVYTVQQVYSPPPVSSVHAAGSPSSSPVSSSSQKQQGKQPSSSGSPKSAGTSSPFVVQPFQYSSSSLTAPVPSLSPVAPITKSPPSQTILPPSSPVSKNVTPLSTSFAAPPVPPKEKSKEEEQAVFPPPEWSSYQDQSAPPSLNAEQGGPFLPDGFPPPLSSFSIPSGGWYVPPVSSSSRTTSLPKKTNKKRSSPAKKREKGRKHESSSLAKQPKRTKKTETATTTIYNTVVAPGSVRTTTAATTGASLSPLTSEQKVQRRGLKKHVSPTVDALEALALFITVFLSRGTEVSPKTRPQMLSLLRYLSQWFSLFHRLVPGAPRGPTSLQAPPRHSSSFAIPDLVSFLSSVLTRLDKLSDGFSQTVSTLVLHQNLPSSKKEIQQLASLSGQCVQKIREVLKQVQQKQAR